MESTTPLEVSQVSESAPGLSGHFVTKNNFIFAKLFFLLNIFFICVSIFSPIDNTFNFCSYNHSDMGTIYAKCPLVFGWYGAYAEFTVTLFYIVFLSAFIGFAPVILFVILYSKTLVDLFKKGKESVDIKEIRLIKVLIVSTIVFPLLLILSYVLVSNNVQSFYKKQDILLETTTANAKTLLEKRMDEIVKNNPDFCKEAPENIFLNLYPTPHLSFPAGYWTGIGVVQVSKENVWDGVSYSPEFVFYSNGIPNFSATTESNLYLNDYLLRVKVDEKYDIRVSTLKKDQMPLVYYNNKDYKPVPDWAKYSFKNGFFLENFKNGFYTLVDIYGQLETVSRFSISSSTRVTQEECLTVPVVDKPYFSALGGVYSASYILDGQKFSLNRGFVNETDPKTGVKYKVQIYDDPLYFDINGDGSNDSVVILTKTPGDKNDEGLYYIVLAIAKDKTLVVTNSIVLGKRNEIYSPTVEINNGQIVYNYYLIDNTQSATFSKYTSKSMLIDYDITTNQISLR
jgi:hypothetical protein